MLRRISCVLICLAFLSGCTRQNSRDIELSTDELAAVVLPYFEMAMTGHTEPAHIEAFTGIDIIITEEITLYQQALTVHLAEIIIIKPAEGMDGEVIDFLNARRLLLREQLAAYPLQSAAAEGMVVGSVHNVAYLICHEDAPQAEAALLKYINENN